MFEQLITIILDDSKWLTISMCIAFAVVAALLYRQYGSDSPFRSRILIAMNLFFSVMIGTMAFGHQLAVTTKLLLGSLEGSIVVFYLIGIALSMPSWWMILHTFKVFVSGNVPGRKMLVLNAWTAITLLAFGLHNFPLAAPALFNIGYQLNSHRVVGWVIVVIATVFYLGLFVGSFIFLLSGQSFEQFRGID